MFSIFDDKKQKDKNQTTWWVAEDFQDDKKD